MKKKAQLPSQMPLFQNELPIIALSKPKSFNEMKEGQQEKRVYKITDVGVIPENWEVQTLGKVSTISRLAGAEYTAFWKETPNGEIISLRGFNIGQGKIIERDFVRISNKLSLKLKRSRLCKDDVVYPCVGSIGNSVVINENEKYHIQQNIARITPEPKKINPYYLAYFLMSPLAEREVERFTSSSSQPSVLVGSLRQFQIPLPPNISEQCIIAEALNDVDALLDSLDRLIAKKRDIKQAAMQQLLTGKTRLPGFDDEWEATNFGKLYLEPSRNGIYKTAEFQGRGIRTVNMGEMFGFDFISDQEMGRVSLTLRETIINGLENGDLLFGRRSVVPSGAGKCSIVILPKEPLTFESSIIRIRLNQAEANPLFYYYFFSSTIGRSLMGMIISGTNIKGIKSSDLKDLLIPLPPISEQQAIAKVLFEIDKEIEALIQRREKTRAIKQGMMQELLTGRTRLV